MFFVSHSKQRRHGILLDHPRDGDRRCFDCGGDCCRAFADVVLTWDEYERLRDLGATRLQLPLTGSPRLLIDYGCEFLIDGRCSIYAARPEICRRFICVDAT